MEVLVTGQIKQINTKNLAKFAISLFSFKTVTSKKISSRIRWLYKNFLNNNMVEKTNIHLEFYGNLLFGKNLILQDAFIDSRDFVTIQNNVFFGWNVKVLTGMHDIYSVGVNRQLKIQSRPVTIEEGVWVASYCIILPGTYIGNNSVVSAGSVLHGRYEPKSLIAGNPAKTIRRLL